MKQKVIFFHPYFRNGGVERTNTRVGKYLTKLGYEVVFLSLSFEGEIQNEAKNAGIQLVSLQSKRTVFAVGKIRKYIREQKKDAFVHLICCQNFASILAFFSLLGERKNIQLIFAERNDPIYLQMSKSLKDKLILFGIEKIYKKADLVTGNSKELAEDLSKVAKCPVRSVYNPTYSEAFLELSKEPVYDKWFTEDIPIVLAVGRLEKQKDYELLIEAFALVRAKIVSRLVIVGEGSQKEMLLAKVAELGLNTCVKFLDFDANPYKYMARADVFVVSSKYEGLCNTLIEATAVRTPCVATECKSGTREILLDGKGGKLSPVGDAYALAKSIVWVLENPKDADRLMEVAYKNLDRFDERIVGEQYISLLKGEI